MHFFDSGPERRQRRGQGEKADPLSCISATNLEIGKRTELRGRSDLDGSSPVGYDRRREEIVMALDPELLAILACPFCKADVKETADGLGLKCVECHRVYPIQDEIPVMLIDEATIDGAPAKS